MSPATLTLLSGGAAVLGGSLRVLASFVPWQADSPGLEAFYLVIDLALLFGLVGIYLGSASRLGALGCVGFAAAFAGLASIVGPDPVWLGVDLYTAGSAVLCLGLAALAVAMLRGRVLAPWIPSLWLAVPVIAGIAGALGRSDQGLILAGVAFGAAFAAAGARMLIAPPGNAATLAIALPALVTLAGLAPVGPARAADDEGESMPEAQMELNQVTLPAVALADSIDFYTRFGLRLIVHSPENQYARFEIPGGQGTLSVHVTGGRVREPAPHVYFETATPDTVVERLRGQGIEPIEPLEDKPWLWREAWYVDPAGNRLCIYNAGENRKHPPWRVGN